MPTFNAFKTLYKLVERITFNIIFENRYRYTMAPDKKHIWYCILFGFLKKDAVEIICCILDEDAVIHIIRESWYKRFWEDFMKISNFRWEIVASIESKLCSNKKGIYCITQQVAQQVVQLFYKFYKLRFWTSQKETKN